MDSVFANMGNVPTPTKRSRDQVDGDPSPGKRAKTNMLVEEQRAREQQQALAAPPPSPTPHWSTALARQQQRALEMMQGDAMDQEDVEMGADGAQDHGTGPEGAIQMPSNPHHAWNDAPAPRMMHQLSTTSLSGASSSADSSLPNTPLDLPFNEQWDPSSGAVMPSSAPKPIRASYPSSSNPTSFTDLNGTTIVFSSSPPLSVYPPPPASMSTPQQMNPLHAAAGFPMHAWSAAAASSTCGVLRMGAVPGSDASNGAAPSSSAAATEATSSAEVVRELNLPAYGWDMPRQGNTLNMGSHLV
ncbi:hypothetical protein JCM8202_004458 [Rhodotorula sphaerocarpa]